VTDAVNDSKKPTLSRSAGQAANGPLPDTGHSPVESKLKIRIVSAYGAAAFDAAAAALSLATARLSSPRAVLITGTFSGSLWTGAAALKEFGNSPRSTLVSGANLLGGAAGALSIAAPFLSGDNLKGTAYASAGSWVANGAAQILRAAENRRGNTPHRLLSGTGGAANIAAAGLSAAAVNASVNDDEARAATLATASSAMWMVGSTAEALAVWIGHNGSTRLDAAEGLEHGAVRPHGNGYSFTRQTR
jgi:hypothetical protein